MAVSTLLSPPRPGGQKHSDYHVTACIDHATDAAWIVPHALALARALAAPVTLLHVLDARRHPTERPDPIESALRRHEILNVLSAALPSEARLDEATEVTFAEGHPADEICRFSSQQSDAMLVCGMDSEVAPGGRNISDTVHAILHRAAASVMLVPEGPQAPDLPRYRRIMVPLDGSPWGESALPLAAQLARANGAELVLAHAIPKPELTETCPYEAADLDLRRRVVERNERIASTYLERVRGYVRATDLPVSVVCVHGPDVRMALAGVLEREHIDLVVLSARGHGIGARGEMPYGSVAAYLMAHSLAPMLIYRAAQPAPNGETRLHQGLGNGLHTGFKPSLNHGPLPGLRLAEFTSA